MCASVVKLSSLLYVLQSQSALISTRYLPHCYYYIIELIHY